MRFAEFIRKNYQIIITATVIVGLLLGLWTTSPGKAVQGYSQALTLVMILFISLTITPRQFALVARQPAACFPSGPLPAKRAAASLATAGHGACPALCDGLHAPDGRLPAGGNVPDCDRKILAVLTPY